jgi:hypothetical protein
MYITMSIWKCITVLNHILISPSQGRRLLRLWIMRPLLNKAVIEGRLDMIEHLIRDSESAGLIRKALKQVRVFLRHCCTSRSNESVLSMGMRRCVWTPRTANQLRLQLGKCACADALPMCCRYGTPHKLFTDLCHCRPTHAYRTSIHLRYVWNLQARGSTLCVSGPFHSIFAEVTCAA